MDKIEELTEWAEEQIYNSIKPETKPPWFLVHENDEDAIFCNKLAKQILSHPDLAEGLELLEKVRQGTTIEAIITKKRKRPDLVFTDD